MSPAHPNFFHIKIYTHTYLPTYLPTYLHTYIHAYIHTYIHTHTYIHACIHTYMWQKKISDHSPVGAAFLAKAVGTEQPHGTDAIWESSQYNRRGSNPKILLHRNCLPLTCFEFSCELCAPKFLTTKWAQRVCVYLDPTSIGVACLHARECLQECGQ